MSEKSANLTSITFGDRRFQQTLHSHKEVLDKFYSGFDDAKELKGTAHIFLDTNVLLRIYSTSFKAREKLLQFFKDYKSRIVLTGQVQWEYVKNRENVITKFSKDVTQTIPENFRGTILESIIKFSADNKIILTDYPSIGSDLEKLRKQAEKLLDIIDNEVKNDKFSSDTILYKDEFISLFQELELLKPLEDDYTSKLRKEFDEFIKEIEKTDTDKETFKTFPGCYEKKEKINDPYGDYIIYHEMMLYAKKHTTDIIFLTYDVTKGDWMQKNRNPHLHYVENFYQNTGRIIYILDGQRTFDELLDINFKSLLKQPRTGTDINVETLQIFLDAFSPLNIFRQRQVTQIMVDELYYNEIKSIEVLDRYLTSTATFLEQIKVLNPGFSRIGAMRASLCISNPNYMIDRDKRKVNFANLHPGLLNLRLS